VAIFTVPVIDELQAQKGFRLFQVIHRIAKKTVHPLGEGLGLVGGVCMAGVHPGDRSFLIIYLIHLAMGKQWDEQQH